MDDLAEKLTARSRTTMIQIQDGGGPADWFISSLGMIEVDRAIASMANKSVSRETCLAKLQWIEANWPQNEYGAIAAECRDQLQQAVALTSDIDLADEATLTRPDVLVRLLVESNGDEFYHQGSFNEIGQMLVYSELLELGTEAIPVLERYSDSQVPTRWVEFDPPSPARLRWVTLGEVASHVRRKVEARSKAGN